MCRERRRVLVFPAGTEIGLEILAALRYCKEVELYGAGQDVSNHARLAYGEYDVLPNVHDEGWLDALTAICARRSIEYIFPAHDDVVLALARSLTRVPATVVSSPLETCEVARSKSATYRALAGVLRVPAVYAGPHDVVAYPVFVKPDRGQGSVGARKVGSREELLCALREVDDPIVCEYLPGDEYTVDCFSDRERGLLFARPRSRRRTRNGISVNTVTEGPVEVVEMAAAISRALPFWGAWFFQVRRAWDGQLGLLEIAPRIAGAMAAHRVVGVNFPLLSLFEAERRALSIHVNPGVVELDRALGNRYRYDIEFSSLYLDLDDTLVVDGKVNRLAIQLVFQCISDGKPVVLLTRHREDLDATLRRYRLDGLFDRVIHLRQGEPKSSCIQGEGAIVVDDSFAERMEVARERGILTFDSSMIELLTERAR